jgi:hypothetical protein
MIFDPTQPLANSNEVIRAIIGDVDNRVEDSLHFFFYLLASCEFV